RRPHGGSARGCACARGEGAGGGGGGGGGGGRGGGPPPPPPPAEGWGWGGGGGEPRPPPAPRRPRDDDTWWDEECDRDLARVELAASPGEVLGEGLGVEHAERNAEKLEQPRRNLPHEDVLGRIFAGVAAPGDEQQGRQAAHQP